MGGEFYEGHVDNSNSFDANTGKRIGVEEDGARFNPFSGAPLPNVPTMYAADSLPGSRFGKRVPQR
jgi:hypothetical protein